MKRLLITSFSLLLGLLVIGSPRVALSQTYTYTVLHAFHGRDGRSPYAALLLDKFGTLYGTTTLGGKYHFGTVFKLTPNGKLISLYSFTGGGNSMPYGGLIMDRAGNLFGTTKSDGLGGTVFELDKARNETLLLSPAGGPYGGVISDSAGNLYSTGSYGGAFNDGMVFELTPSNGGWIETILHSFKLPKDPGNPHAGLVMDAIGNLYGTTYGDNGSSSRGTIFKLNKAGHKKVLHTFEGPEGNSPETSLILDKASNLYGTAGGGQYDAGVIFKVDNEGNYVVLHSFAGYPSDGDGPVGALLMDASGNLYGTTASGGSNQRGVVFKLDKTNTETILYNFTGNTDGGQPFAGLIMDKSGNLYGTTAIGGDLPCPNPNQPIGCGTVFKLSPN
jgi:uncharacterized repeat protein (TIGR03803 family)